MPDLKPTMLETAAKIVTSDRNVLYGTPFDNFTHIARVWSVVLQIEVTAEQVALCMIGVKICRAVHAYTPDNMADIAGYAQCHEFVVEERKRRANPEEQIKPKADISGLSIDYPRTPPTEFQTGKLDGAIVGVAEKIAKNKIT